MPAPLIIAKLVHYPVKGLAGLAKAQSTLTQGEGMPLDAFTPSGTEILRFDAQDPKWLQLMRHERLANLA